MLGAATIVVLMFVFTGLIVAFRMLVRIQREIDTYNGDDPLDTSMQ